MAVTVKSAHEIQLMREAGEILAKVHEELAEVVKPGVTTFEINRRCEKLIRGYGCIPSFLGYEGFPASVCVSVNDEVVHGIPSKKRVIREGDIVSLDTGVIWKGWQSDAARTWAVGEITPEAQALIDVTRESFFEGLKYAKAGNHLNDICGAIGDYASSRGYITATANVLSEEKMAIVLQEICGSEDRGYYFPTFSGVARSVNFYPIGYEKPEDGVAKLAFGLGKAVVDGDQVLRFSPKYPRNVLQTSTPELTMSETQQAMFALNLQPDKFKTSVDDGVNLDRIPITECGPFRNFARVVSTYDYENMRIVDSPVPQGPKFVTFAHILKYNTFPLADILNELLDIMQREVKCGVEIEFAANLDRGPDALSIFNVLQVRPISLDGLDAEVDWSGVDAEGAIVASGSAIGPGWINGVRDVVYLRESAFDVLKTREMAAQLKDLNARMRTAGRNYVLVGYGRWGSSIPSLGVPVQWSDISEARAIVECCLEHFRVDPSQGTHFFQNMTSFNAGYVNVNPFARPDECFDAARLDAMEAEFETEYLRLVHFDADLQICIDGRTGRALIK